MIQGDIDTSYQVQQRDLFASGRAAEMGGSAYFVWNAIKHHADYETGEAWPGVRGLMRLTGLASDTVVAALAKLQEHHMLRVAGTMGQKQIYIARERLDVRVGKRVLCTVVIDYVPQGMRERLARLQAALAGGLDDEDVWADVDIIPGPGLTWDPERKALRGKLRADEVPTPAVLSSPDKPDVPAVRARLRLQSAEIRATCPQVRSIRS